VFQGYPLVRDIEAATNKPAIYAVISSW